MRLTDSSVPTKILSIDHAFFDFSVHSFILLITAVVVGAATVSSNPFFSTVERIL